MPSGAAAGGDGADAGPWGVRLAIWFWSASHAADERHRWLLHRHAPAWLEHDRLRAACLDKDGRKIADMR